MIFIEFEDKEGDREILNLGHISLITQANQNHQGHGCKRESKLNRFGTLIVQTKDDGSYTVHRATRIFDGEKEFENHPLIHAINNLPVLIPAEASPHCSEMEKAKLMDGLEKFAEILKK